MKKLLIGGLMGGLILFFWQFLSHGPLDLHGPQMEYTANQDVILEVLEANLEEGEYFVPRLPRGSTTEEQMAEFEKRRGKPWATINYHESFEINQAENMFRGFLADFLAALLWTWILMKFAQLDVITSIFTSIGVGLIGYLTIKYLNTIWFEGNSWPDLLDAIVPWTLIGAWSSWWLNR